MFVAGELMLKMSEAVEIAGKELHLKLVTTEVFIRLEDATEIMAIYNGKAFTNKDLKFASGMSPSRDFAFN